MSHQKVVGVLCRDDSDSLSEDEEFCPQSVLDKLPCYTGRPKLTKEELKMKHSYTFDPEPVKAWREITDYMVIQECNDVLWGKISQHIGRVHGYRNRLFLYRNRYSKLVHLIERMLCQHKCYYFPKTCLLRHGYDFKNLLKKSLHDRFNPSFSDLFTKDTSKVAMLEREKNGQPRMIKLAEDIGFTTDLVYGEDGFLNVDLSVFREEFWNVERPCYVKEEKKVLDMIYGLLISSSVEQDEQVSLATVVYSQKSQGLNEPILKTMCFGPDIEFQGYPSEENFCDITKDEPMPSELRDVEHRNCSFFKREYHWKFVHHEIDEDQTKECTKIGNLLLEGPASTKDAFLVYPCNLKHCWRCCMCSLCHYTRVTKCENHKEHMKYNKKECLIQQMTQCQEHWLDHPKNFKNGEDIEIEKTILFHNNEVKRDGRNYRHKTAKYAGLKMFCYKCRQNTKEHLNEHLSPHMQCKHCLHEMRTMDELSFWDRVCEICGKILNDAISQIRHNKKHDVIVPECELCGGDFSSKFNLHRHMVEQHNTFQKGDDQAMNSENEFACVLCDKTFKYKRNLDAHIQSHNSQGREYKCNICDDNFTASSSLKRHLLDQHKIGESEESIYPEKLNVFICQVCDSVFHRKDHLKAHDMTHIERTKFTCDQCGKQFTVMSSLTRHQQIHKRKDDKYKCDICHKTFLSNGSLGRHKEGVHKL